jgi:hypothetical protein
MKNLKGRDLLRDAWIHETIILKENKVEPMECTSVFLLQGSSEISCKQVKARLAGHLLKASASIGFSRRRVYHGANPLQPNPLLKCLSTAKIP